jgi:hypothetical protein
MRKALVALVAAYVVALASPVLAATVRVGAVGDIGDEANYARQKVTAAEMNNWIGSASDGKVFMLGDIQYENGTVEEYDRSFNVQSLASSVPWGYWSTFGPPIQRDKARPVPGNHEYGSDEDPATGRATGYRREFRNQEAPPYKECPPDCTDADKFNLTYEDGSINGWDWYFIDSTWCAEHSEMCEVGGQYYNYVASLIPDNDSLNSDCVGLVMHDPRFASPADEQDPELGQVRDLVKHLYGLFDTEAGADIVLSASYHHYERYNVLDKNGNDPGMGQAPRQFVVGTGGANFPTEQADWEDGVPDNPDPVAHDISSGILKLILYPGGPNGGYDYAFVATSSSYRDPGSGFAHNDCTNNVSA